MSLVYVLVYLPSSNRRFIPSLIAATCWRKPLLGEARPSQHVQSTLPG